MSVPVYLKRGNKSALPSTGMVAGDHFVVQDESTFWMATGATTKINIIPDISNLAATSTMATDDLLMVYDVSVASGNIKGRQITFADFKTALNIPAGATDEKAAVVSGGTSGYIWGTTGSDGIIRVAANITMTKDAGNGFVTLKIGLASQAQGDIMYFNGTDWVRLGAGSAGNVLQSGGAGANPSWAAAIDAGTF